MVVNVSFVSRDNRKAATTALDFQPSNSFTDLAKTTNTVGNGERRQSSRHTSLWRRGEVARWNSKETAWIIYVRLALSRSLQATNLVLRHVVTHTSFSFKSINPSTFKMDCSFPPGLKLRTPPRIPFPLAFKRSSCSICNVMPVQLLEMLEDNRDGGFPACKALRNVTMVVELAEVHNKQCLGHAHPDDVLGISSVGRPLVDGENLENLGNISPGPALAPLCRGWRRTHADQIKEPSRLFGPFSIPLSRISVISRISVEGSIAWETLQSWTILQWPHLALAGATFCSWHNDTKKAFQISTSVFCFYIGAKVLQDTWFWYTQHDCGKNKVWKIFDPKASGRCRAAAWIQLLTKS